MNPPSISLSLSIPPPHPTTTTHPTTQPTQKGGAPHRLADADAAGRDQAHVQRGGDRRHQPPQPDRPGAAPLRALRPRARHWRARRRCVGWG